MPHPKIFRSFEDQRTRVHISPATMPRSIVPADNDLFNDSIKQPGPSPAPVSQARRNKYCACKPKGPPPDPK